MGDNQGTSDGLLRNSFLLYVECHLDHFFFIDCFRIISEGEEKEIVLKAENEEARDSWLKKVVSASVAFSQAKRKRKKEMNDKSMLFKMSAVPYSVSVCSVCTYIHIWMVASLVA